MDLRAKQGALQGRLRDLMQMIQQHDATLQQMRGEATKVVGQLELLAEQLKEIEVQRVHDGDLSGTAGGPSVVAERPARQPGSAD
jgi:hypothetical protein